MTVSVNAGGRDAAWREDARAAGMSPRRRVQGREGEVG